ncbi:hypothetical protein DRF67_15350 [Chryseobacterium pennipullorum]|uniref:Uncharacterized protein n=1 Tax=Chryseobacterium pennipullorum TaxID=2258963 RepID=A0A3D9AXY9_9FLAO|nr:hypothetical protein DRF67_15350 [Chryseobacterium pennipullorum]
MKKTLFLFYTWITFRFFSKIHLRAEGIILNFRAPDQLKKHHSICHFYVVIYKESAYPYGFIELIQDSGIVEFIIFYAPISFLFNYC